MTLKDMMKKTFHIAAFILTFACFLFTDKAIAQEYLYEIGGFAGTAAYMGDANQTNPLKNPGSAAGVVFRYNTNFRWAIKGNLAFGHVSGDTQTSGNVFPNNQQVRFSRNFCELGGQIEFNFFNYSDKYAYLGTRRYAPYIFTGLGLTYAMGNNPNVTMNLPLGIGLKYKIKERLNFGFEFSMRKLFGDSFDVTNKEGLVLDDPYNIKSSILKNKDWYTLTMITLTWDFGIRINRSCHK